MFNIMSKDFVVIYIEKIAVFFVLTMFVNVFRSLSLSDPMSYWLFSLGQD